MFLGIFITIPLSAAPVLNIGDPSVRSPGILGFSGLPSVVATVSVFTQDNDLPIQKTRFNWTNPDSSTTETRAYNQNRSSANTMTLSGLRIGVPFDRSYFFYANLGASRSKINFHYEDWTVSRSFSRDDTFTSGPDPYYGIGFSAVMSSWNIAGKYPLSFGLDAQYTRFEFSDDRTAENNVAYSCRLEEVQLGFILSAVVNGYSPYIGVKADSLTGNEDYTDKNDTSPYYPEGYVHYSKDIGWFKGIGYSVGVSRYFLDRFSLGAEIRFGDEKGWGINSSTRF